MAIPCFFVADVQGAVAVDFHNSADRADITNVNDITANRIQLGGSTGSPTHQISRRHLEVLVQLYELSCNDDEFIRKRHSNNNVLECVPHLHQITE